MERGRPTRYSAASIRLKTNLRCQAIYPMPGSTKKLDELKSVGFLFTRDEAIDLARTVLAMTQDMDPVAITGYRSPRRRSDGTFHVTVTSPRAAGRKQRAQTVVPCSDDYGIHREWRVQVADTHYCILNEDETWYLFDCDPDVEGCYATTYEDVEKFLTTHNLILTA